MIGIDSSDRISSPPAFRVPAAVANGAGPDEAPADAEADPALDVDDTAAAE